MDGEAILSGFFEEAANFSADNDILSVLEAWENASDYNNLTTSLKDDDDEENSFEFQKSSSSSSSPLINAAAAATASFQKYSESELDASQSSKRQKLMTDSQQQQQVEEAQNRISHIAVERNRRKQMNEHLSVLRSLMPCFYVKRGDQASIIGGVVDYINELQQVLQSLEAKKQRKSAYNEVLSPRLASSPRIAIASSPRLSLPISPRPSPRLPPLSPRTPQPSSPYNVKPWMQVQGGSFLNSPSTSIPSPIDPSPPCSINSSTANDAVVNELVATSKSALAEVEVKFSGPNLLLKTVSHRLPGQVMKIVSALEELALEILHVSISTVDETMLNSFTIKIGIQCQLSAEDLAEQIQRTFS